jgi:hypothetical protein
MDLEQVFIFDVGWLFFAAWGLVLAAVSVIAFGRDILPALPRLTRESDQHETARVEPDPGVEGTRFPSTYARC